jgi:diguanylate cyclase (GGDEF)-like protein
MLSLFIGVLGLLAYRSSKDTIALFVATGFLAAGVLDGYHTLVSSRLFIMLFPSAPIELIAWSWWASRVFLAVLLWLSWLFWRRTQGPTAAGHVNERLVFALTAGLALACFAFFAWVRIPLVRHAQIPVPRVQELVPALFFLLALAGYLHKGGWRSNPFDHWLVLGLIVSFFLHAAYMMFSDELYDAMFNAAHVLKCLSYLFVLVGVLFDLSRVYSESAAQKELKILHAQLREQAVRDPMTGLYNRRYLDEALARDLARAARSKRPLTLAIGDVDHFKAVNDTYGHQAGDEVLKTVADLLQRDSRGGDITSRYGGEEFLMVLPEMTAVQAHARAQQWRAGIAAAPIVHGSAVIRVTASFGIASFPLHGTTADALIAAADSALYAAKRAGRNKVRIDARQL